MVFTHRLICACVLLLPGCGYKMSPEVIAIGHVVNMQGPHRQSAELEKQGIALAVADQNQGPMSQAGSKLGVLHVDWQNNTELLQPIAVRLLTINRVAALLGGYEAVEAFAMGRAAQSYDAAVLTWAMLPGSGQGENVFSLLPGLQRHGEALALCLADPLKSDRVTLVLDKKEKTASALAEIVLREVNRRGGLTIEELAFEGDADFALLITKMQTQTARVLLFAGSLDRLASFRKQAGEQLRQSSILFAGCPGQLNLLTRDSRAFENIHFLSPYAPEQFTSAGKTFLDEHKNLSSDPPSLSETMAYEGVLVLSEAIRRAKPLVPTRIRSELAGTLVQPIEGLTGPLSFELDGSARRTLHLIQMAAGQLKTIKSFEPPSR